MPLTYYSTAPAFKAAMLTALSARSGLSGVTISYGVPLNVTMTGTVRVAELLAPFNLEEFASDQARQSILTLGIQATERI